MPQTNWHCFSSQLLTPLQMVCLVLLTVSHLKTLQFIGCEFSTANQKPTNKWFKLQHREKTEHSIWKSNKNWAENWCLIVCGILFDLISCMTSSETCINFLSDLLTFDPRVKTFDFLYKRSNIPTIMFNCRSITSPLWFLKGVPHKKSFTIKYECSGSRWRRQW